MESMQVDLPSGIREFVEEQVAQGGYQSPSEYIGKLILEHRERKTRQEMDRKLTQGLDSGPAVPWASHDLEASKQRVLDRYPLTSEGP